MITTHQAGPHREATWTAFCLLWGALALAGCTPSGGEVELVPESREGVFYTSFAEAQRVASSENKYILLDMWRPG